jgi:hypothetical protein
LSDLFDLPSCCPPCCPALDFSFADYLQFPDDLPNDNPDSTPQTSNLESPLQTALEPLQITQRGDLSANDPNWYYQRDDWYGDGLQFDEWNLFKSHLSSSPDDTKEPCLGTEPDQFASGFSTTSENAQSQDNLVRSMQGLDYQNLYLDQSPFLDPNGKWTSPQAHVPHTSLAVGACLANAPLKRKRDEDQPDPPRMLIQLQQSLVQISCYWNGCQSRLQRVSEFQ